MLQPLIFFYFDIWFNKLLNITITTSIFLSFVFGIHPSMKQFYQFCVLYEQCLLRCFPFSPTVGHNFLQLSEVFYCRFPCSLCLSKTHIDLYVIFSLAIRWRLPCVAVLLAEHSSNHVISCWLVFDYRVTHLIIHVIYYLFIKISTSRSAVSAVCS